VLEYVDHRVGELDLVQALAAAEASGAEDVDLHEPVAHDVETHQEHAVGHERGPHGLRHLQHGIVDLDPLRGATDAHVRTTVGRLVHPPEGCVVTTHDEGTAVHEEHSNVALVGVGQDLLGDDVAVAADRLDHLVQVR